jgi:DNA-binding transcriptional ArsR family regulator
MPDFDEIHKVLSSPVRRQILQWLKQPEEFFPDREFVYANGVSAGMIHARTDLSQSTISAHLAALNRVGLVSTKRVGQWVFFARNEETIRSFIAYMAKALR